MMFKQTSVLVCALAAVLLAGCGSKDDSEPAVATPSLSLSRERVPIGSPLKLTYRFDVAPNAKIDGDYWVFVHVLEPDGEQLWVDDHLPPAPTSTWKPGAESRIHADRLRPELSVHRARGGADRPLQSENQPKRLTLAGEVASRKEYPGREVRAPAAVREHLPDLQGGMAPGGGLVRTIPTPSGSGPRSPPPSRSGTRRRMGRCISSTPAGSTSSRPSAGHRPHRRSAIGTLRGDVEGQDARHLPSHRRPVRVGRRRGARHSTSTGRSCPAAPIRVSWESRSSTLS